MTDPKLVEIIHELRRVLGHMPQRAHKSYQRLENAINKLEILAGLTTLNREQNP